jgi:hypothetical protein
MAKNRNYGYYEALDLDWLNKHPDAPVMFKVKKQLKLLSGHFILAFIFSILVCFFLTIAYIIKFGG